MNPATFLKRRDIFGHRISMNFDDKYPTHNTWIGGLFTLFTYFCICAMVGFKIHRVINYNNPDLNSITEMSNQGLLDDHDYYKLDGFMFYALVKQLKGHLFLDYPDLDTYVRIYFMEEIADFTQYGKGEVYSRKFHKAVQCTQEHFGFDEEGVESLRKWEGHSLVCLDLKTSKDLQIQGDISALNTKNLVFLIDRC